MKEYGRIRWIESFEDVPVSAEYVVRELYDDSVRLERYEDDKQFVLKDFPIGAFDEEEDFESTLIECRKIMKNRKILWVVMPIWKLYP